MDEGKDMEETKGEFILYNLLDVPSSASPE